LTLGENVKRYRKQRGLTQKEVALIAGISGATVSEIESETKPPSMKMLKKLATALRCTPADLLKED